MRRLAPRSYLDASALVLALAACQRPTAESVAAAERPQPSAAPSAERTPADIAPDPPGTYMGRTIAPTMTFHGANWLTRSERQDEEDTAQMHAQLGLSPGRVACDIGAGNGYHTLLMARAVAPSGTAVAVEIQQEMLDLLAVRARDEGVTNVRLVLADPRDPKLAAGTCDLILLADVYHELEDPAAMLDHLRRALEPGGRIVLLEFRAEDPDVPIKEEHKMSKAQILREFEVNGLRLVGEHDGLPWQHMMFFAAK